MSDICRSYCLRTISYFTVLDCLLTGVLFMDISSHDHVEHSAIHCDTAVTTTCFRSAY